MIILPPPAPSLKEGRGSLLIMIFILLLRTAKGQRQIPNTQHPLTHHLIQHQSLRLIFQTRKANGFTIE